jgi:putative (di)nucleoside polyphosphate hydrolase
MIDKDGYRANVGMIIVNADRKVLWAKRIRNKNAWQFPQGGVDSKETPEQTMYRELKEEIGLDPEHIEILAQTKKWLRYQLPKHLLRRNSQPLCIGQKQKWFLLRLVAEESAVNLQAGEKPEFTEWCWVDYWHPLENIIYFKRDVYTRALKEFEKIVFRNHPC